MYVLVVGCGKVGHQLTRILRATGHEVLTIEKDPRRHESLRLELGSIAMEGDGTDLEVLKDAGAARADLVIAVAARDEDNLVICQLAKHHFHAPRTMALLRDPHNEPLFKLLDVDVTINGTHMILSAIEDEIPGHALVHLMNLKGEGMIMVRVSIPPDASVVGRALGDIALPPNSFISLVAKRHGPVLPSEEVLLESGDDVVAVTSPDEERLLYEALTGLE